MLLEKDGRIAQAAIKQMLSENDLSDDGILDETEFLEILIHASGYRFGMAIESIGLAKLDQDAEVTMDHFAEDYYVGMNCDDEINPFISRFWQPIYTSKALDRYILEDKNRRKKLLRT